MATNQHNERRGSRVGKNSPEYVVVQHHQGPLVKGISKALSQTTKDLFKSGVLDSDELEKARDSTQPEYQRAIEVMNCVLKKIEDDVSCYNKLIAVLKSYSGLEELAKDMESALHEDKHCCNKIFVSGNQPSKPFQDYQHTPNSKRRNSGKRPRSFSDSTINDSELKPGFTNEEIDSAFHETTTAQGPQNDPEDEYLNYDSHATPQGQMPEHQGFTTPVSASQTLGMFQSSHSPADGGPATDMGNTIPPSLSIEEQTSEQTLSEKSDFALGMHSVGHSHCLQKAELLKGKIHDLERDKQQLTEKHQEEIEDLKKKSEQKENELHEHISKKDNIIDNLQKDQDSKNEMIKKLRKEKDDIENQIAQLKEELRTSKEMANETIQKERQECQDKVASLTEELEKVKFDQQKSLAGLKEELDNKTAELKRVQESEEKALREIAEIKDQLTEVKLAKQEEQHKFELEKQRLEFEKQMALKETENKINEKAKELLESKLKLSELEKDCAKELKEMAAKNEKEAKEREEAAMKREEEAKEREEAALKREEEAKEREVAMRKKLEAFENKKEN